MCKAKLDTKLCSSKCYFSRLQPLQISANAWGHFKSLLCMQQNSKPKADRVTCSGLSRRIPTWKFTSCSLPTIPNSVITYFQKSAHCYDLGKKKNSTGFAQFWIVRIESRAPMSPGLAINQWSLFLSPKESLLGLQVCVITPNLMWSGLVWLFWDRISSSNVV